MFNFVVFIAAGRFFFDASQARGLSRLFVPTYLSLFAGTVCCQYSAPHQGATRMVCSVTMLACSIILFWSTFSTVRKQPFTVIFSPDKPTRIVTSGPYSYVRHPFYTSYLVTFFASALASDHPGAWLCSAIASLIYFSAARMEEKKFAASELASAYAEFRGRTGMFLPRLLPGHGAGGKGLSA